MKGTFVIVSKSISNVCGASTLLTMASVLVRAEDIFDAASESGKISLNNSLEQSEDL